MGSTEDEIGSARTEIGSTATHMEPKSGPAQTESEPPVLHSHLSTQLLMPSFLGPRGKNFRPGDGRFGFSLVHCTIVALVTDSHAYAAVLTGIRVRRVMATARSKSVASNIMRGFRKRCKEIRDLGGGAARRG